MIRRPIFAFVGAISLLTLWGEAVSANSLVQQDTGSIFLGSPFLILGILVGLVAAGFAFYSATLMRGGRMNNVLNLLGVSLLLLDIGVIAVTFFPVGEVTKLIHDLGLLFGFLIALVAFNQMRRIVG